MWFSLWRSRNRFSLDELRYLTDQLQKVQIVTEVNKDFVIEALRSIAELVTYGDQHDPLYFEIFMENQIMGEFVRILKVSGPTKVALQLLQTMSIIIQNIRSEHAIYYIFSNEHINYLITYSFDFQNDELLQYYISFLRAISVKLNKSTIPLLVNTQNDEVVSFPLYVEAIRFAFHEENMIRTAIRALTLNVYHAGDESVNNYVSGSLLSDYFSELIEDFRKQCINLDQLVSQAAMNAGSSDLSSQILAAIDEIEDTLYYFSDVISAGVPDLERLLTDNILQLLVFPILLPSLKRQITGEEMGITSSLYLLCCILRIVKTKDLASTIAATLFFPPEVFNPKSKARPSGYGTEHSDFQDAHSLVMHTDAESSQSYLADGSSEHDSSCYLSSESNSCSHTTLREIFLSYIASGDDIQVLGSLTLLSTLLQTKELDESMLDRLGILPQRKQLKKHLLQALMGEGSGEDQLFSFKSGTSNDNIHTELDRYLQILKERHGIVFCYQEQGTSPESQRYQVLDALITLFSRVNLSADTLWIGGWLFRQLLPHGEEDFTSNHLKQLKDSIKSSTVNLFVETKGSWCDMLITVLIDEWRNCRRAIEAATSKKDPKSILMPSRILLSEGESSFTTGRRMCEFVKIFVLQHQLLIFSSGASLHDQPPIHHPIYSPRHSREKTADPDVVVPMPGSEINLESALPCRIAFEKGKEHHFCLLAISSKISGWVLLAEELPLKQQYGVVRVTTPLAGSNPRIDDKHPNWLHLCVRPSDLPFRDPSPNNAFLKGKPDVLADGKWTLAFSDEQSCKLAESMIMKEMHLQHSEVEMRLKPLFDLAVSEYAPYSLYLKPLLVPPVE